jgi:hypothetical protein
MKVLATCVALIVIAAMVTAARGGHEFPVYPSYYPHEISIDVVAPERAGDLLLASKIQAYIGSDPRFAEPPPDPLRAVESLGSFVVVRVNPQSLFARDNAAACSIARAIVADIGKQHGPLVFHPFPITSLDGDYLYHADQADAAKAKVGEDTGAASALRRLRVRASSDLAKDLVRPAWYTREDRWDAIVEEVRAGDLLAAATRTTNGWSGAPWARAGWFRSALLLADAADDASTRSRIQENLRRLEHGAYANAVERINLQRELVADLSASCHTMVAGYTLKREYVSTEYSAGIENIAWDAIDGLAAPIFLRTVKLKDFPWNGWLALGIHAAPAAAWNPIAGLTDPFGRLLWSALGDPAEIPAGDSGWLFNRVSDVRIAPSR